MKLKNNGKYKTNSLRFKIVLWFSVCLICLSIGIIAYTSITTYKASVETAEKTLEHTVKDLSWHIQSEIEAILNNLIFLDEIFIQVKNPLQTLLLDRDQIDTILLSVLRNNNEYYAIFTSWEPNAFDNKDDNYRYEPGYDRTGRFSRYWYINKFGVPDVKSLINNTSLNYSKDKFSVHLHYKIINDKEELILSFIYPITIKERYYGMFGIDYIASSILSKIKEQNLLIQDYCYSLISDTGHIIFMDNAEGIIQCSGNELKNNLTTYKQPPEKTNFFLTDKDSIKFFSSVNLPDVDPWWTILSVSKTQFWSETILLINRMIFISLFCIIIIMVIIWILSGLITAPINLLIHEIRELSNGNYHSQIEITKTYNEIMILTYDFNSMVNNIAKREKQLKSALKEKDFLLKELYHRTKNNMQTISGMLSLKAMQYDNHSAYMIVEDINKKINTMSLVHQRVYESENLSEISLNKYIMDIAASFKQHNVALINEIHFYLNLSEIVISIDSAIPIGLVITELIMNSIKHAFQENDIVEKKILIDLSRDNKKNIVIKYSDTGPGLPEDFSLKGVETIGLKTIIKIVESQLNGTIKLIEGKGFCSIVEFKDNIRIKNY